MTEYGVLKGPDIVFHPVEGGVGHRGKLAEGQPDAHEEGHDEADGERGQGG